jgi:archaellum component FlaF (FlaF/FlaG flagellin family)
MKNQLSNIAVQYRKFSKGQYVDYSQFNEFLDFFEDQDRLSRVMLQGVGIVCGLKSKLIYVNDQLNKIQVSQGVALTTDGDLLTLNNAGEISKELYVSDLKKIKLENKEYTHFKAYDNFKIRYPAFNTGPTSQIELWELATTEEANLDFRSIDSLSNLEDKYLLLYLESDEKEIKPCRGVDCDNHGILQIRNLKVLVTTAAGIDHILESDQIQPHPLFVDGIMSAATQERVIVERLILERGVEKPIFSSDLKRMYQDVLERNGYGDIVFKKINEIAKVMGVSTVDHQSFKNSIEECLAQKTGFQYAYDVVKDLMDTYSEITKLLPKAFTKCLPDLVSFPKHVMLGKLISDKQLDSTRHQFYNSPVLDDDKATQRVKVLIDRFKQQAQNFRYSDSFEKEAQIKITPSQKLDPLSNKAIPFYYQVTDEFLKAWNFDKTSNRSFRENLGYDASLLSSATHIQDPLDFNIDKNSFYNIEGHQGMLYQEAFEKIKEIRDKYQLGFDIMALSLQELVNNKDLSKAYFNEYLEKNPGVEHKRGVERKGTFLIVYDIIDGESIVVADLSIPYTCCTPKTDVKLSLPSTVICAEAGRIPFTVTPVNGEVAANLGRGVVLEGGQYFFDPKLVDISLHGQTIAFTVNGKSTNCSIKVITQPDVEIKVVSVDHPSGGSNETVVHFKVSQQNGQDLTNYNYSWDFADHGIQSPLNPDPSGNVSCKLYNLSSNNIPIIKVNVSAGGCTQDIVIRDWYKPSVQLSLPKAVVCSNSSSIPFTVSPIGGVVEANVGGGVKIGGNGQYLFDPQLVDVSLHGQTIAFTVDGQSTNCSIKVITQPDVEIDVVSIDHPSGGSNETVVHFKVSQQNGQDLTNYNYSWDFGGHGIQSPLGPDLSGNVSCKLYNLSSNNIPIIKVTVNNGECTEVITIDKWYTPPRPSLVIKEIRFSDTNCCQSTMPTVAVEATGPTRVPLKNASFKLNGVAQGPPTLIYSWVKLKGPIVTLNGANTPILEVGDLVDDEYEFQLTVVDVESGAFAQSNILVVNVYR